MVPVNPGLLLKINGTGIIITKKGPGFAGTGILVGHYSSQTLRVTFGEQHCHSDRIKSQICLM